jgi:hypothetical protein
MNTTVLAASRTSVISSRLSSPECLLRPLKQTIMDCKSALVFFSRYRHPSFNYSNMVHRHVEADS